MKISVGHSWPAMDETKDAIFYIVFILAETPNATTVFLCTSQPFFIGEIRTIPHNKKLMLQQKYQ